MLEWQPDQILLEVLDWRWGLDDWADQVRLQVPDCLEDQSWKEGLDGRAGQVQLEVLDCLEDLVLAERLDLQPDLVLL